MWLFQPFRLDAGNQSLWRGDISVPLMPKPFAVLQYFVEHAGRLVTQNELAAAIWPDTHVQPDVLRRYILEVRRALGDQAESPRFIETLPKRGYRFIAAVTPGPPDAIARGSATLVGRNAPMGELDGYLQSALSGSRQLVFVSGEAGIGKTTLLDVFRDACAHSSAVHVARGQCIEGFGGKEPFYPLIEALGHLVHGPASTLVVKGLASAAPTWMIQFPALVNQEYRAALQREIMGATRERMVRELCEALELVTREVAIVLLLEDLHWVDNSTLDVLSMMARRRNQARLLVLGTFRPADLILSDSPLQTLKQDLLSHRLASELTLEALREADVAAYLAEEFAGLPHEFAVMIHRRSEGNPLFMTAMLDHLVQTGVVAPDNGKNWRLTAPLDDVDPGVPDTLKQLFDVQLRYLSSDELQLLKCASVAGQQFTVCSVAILLQITLAEVEKKCAALVEKHQFLKSGGMCELPKGGFTVYYEFRHWLYREALYRGLSTMQRVNLHRSMAAGLVDYESVSTPVLAAKIAAHFEAGREFESAIQHLLIAAQTASRRYAHREAMAVLEHARELLPMTGRQNHPRLEREILAKIADLHYTLGEMEQSIATYDSLAVRDADAGDRAAEAEAWMRLSHPAGFVDPERAIAACERGAKLGAATGNPALESQAALLGACWRILVNGWSEADAETCDQAAASLLSSSSSMPAYGRLLYARVMVYRSEYLKALENADQALEELTGGDSLWVAPAAFYTKASALGHMGRLSECADTLAQGFDLARKNNNAEWLGALHYTSFWLRWHTFDMEGIRELVTSIVESGTFRLSLQMRKQLNIACGFAHLAAGQYETARETFEEVLGDSGHGKALWRTRMFAQRGLGEACLALGDLARIDLDALAASVRDTRDFYTAGFTRELCARVALASGALESARQHILQALETLSAADIPVVAWRVHATASDVYRQTDASNADIERNNAEGVIMRIASSLEGVEPLRTSFLAAEPVRRVLERRPVSATSAREQAADGTRSQTSV
jgi:DNA-binding winged helix-turn-helix (wHTH) protein/tetratricopeptide (TPR) repeat protein